ncbi:unnamed protein product [marine sediment metagenome]|uniref:Uncharacterized protein n=1 Tax=marine sediment metagenome TaxID=412755 RepID=X0RYA6_9ZZZZ
MHPVLLIGGAVVALLAGKKKKSSSKSGGGSDPGPDGGFDRLTIKTSTTSPKVGEPWDHCDPPAGSPKKTHAAYGKNGECMVFWGPETWDVARSFIEAEMNRLSPQERDEICNHGECVPDPYAVDPHLFCEWNDNPKAIAAVKRIAVAMYPQLEPALPLEKNPQYFPAIVWQFLWYELAKYQCGFEPVT